MIYDFPLPATPIDAGQLATECSASLVYVAGGILRIVNSALDRPTVAAIIAAHAPVESDASKARRFVVGQITDAVGVAWGSLTTAQKQALIVALLYRAGALDGQTRVRPLAEWL